MNASATEFSKNPPPCIAIVGEALIDFTGSGGLSFEGHEGGAPTNSAVAAARLGQPTAFISQLSTDLFGERLMQHLIGNGVDTRFVLRSDAPTTLAFVERTSKTNRYAFYTQGTADTRWSPAVLPALPDSCHFLQFGSIALLTEPAASRITDFVEAEQGRRVVLFDPNVRPSLIPDVAAFRTRCKRWFAASDLVKLSDEDAALLAPGEPFEQASAAWLALGPRALVITRGGDGATLYRPGRAALEIHAPVIDVVDTIGAGDTFNAGLVVALVEAGIRSAAQLDELDDDAWRRVLAFAAQAAAINCTREGADPPLRVEVQAALDAAES